ncbi:hypothetical protein [Aquimarina sp. 2201CG14-23]|uniref:hypothetical protein n=1 Tax=Aquimarina mycalae TaxID=3040073 RepID=UPI002477F560|nr:hypothetical protein [Aquimarina sp. 2201CG14-23]MDH7448006.1 hypothetical protein [Aquimarina sp. 2201CG14-23]
MIKKICYIYVLIFATYSCDNIVVKKESKETFIEKKWAEIDTNDVEQPPLFKACKFVSEEELESCFRNTITQRIMGHLSDQTIVVNEAINDTVWIPLIITNKGKITLDNFTLPEIITSQIPDFTYLIEESIDNLPKVAPAHTRGTPVTTRYKLPLVISID